VAEKKQGKVTPEADHDRIVMASRTPDGTPAQHNPEFIGDKKVAEEAAAVQLGQQKASAADQALRGVVDTGGVLAEDGDKSGVGSSEPDAAVAEIVDAHEKAQKAADSQAKSEVSKLHEGLGA
jgi:hypothetical protein